MCETSSTTRGVFVGRAVANETLCRDHYRLVLRVPGFPASRPGQFVQLQCRGLGEQAGAHDVDWPANRPPTLTQPELAGREPLLRRPLSLGGRQDMPNGAELTIIYHAVGTGTRWLADVTAGQSLSVLGPLGNGFTVRPDKPLAVLIGGGVGIPPMLYLADALVKSGKKVVAFCGARSAEWLPLATAGEGQSLHAEPLAALGAESVIATDDGSLGYSGFVTNAAADWLKRAQPWPAETVVYACGPEPMMKAAGDIAAADGIECQLALERHMACGMGTCQSCVVKIRDDSPQGWAYKLCCTDGPVFDARSVLW